MSWIAELDTHGREFPTCVHVTKTTHTMTHGATYVPIEDGKAVRDENKSLRELVRMYGEYTSQDRCEGCACKSRCNDGDVDECWQLTEIRELERELGIGAV